jgi:hypothetical protein
MMSDDESNSKLDKHNDDRSVSKQAQQAQQELQDYLNKLRGMSRVGQFLSSYFSFDVYDPVRTKNLEKVADSLHQIITFLDCSPSGDASVKGKESLHPLLAQLHDPAQLSSDSAWELADSLELELVSLADDAYLYVLLKALSNSDSNNASSWAKRLPDAYLDELQGKYKNGKFSEQGNSERDSSEQDNNELDNNEHDNKHDNTRRDVVYSLQYLYRTRNGEFRHDRAKIRLRGSILFRVAFILSLLLILLSFFYIAAEGPPRPSKEISLVFLALFSGAAGSVLSRAIKIAKQPLHADTGNELGEPPLGIRALTSDWKVFLAQPIIGATAALILFFIVQEGLLTGILADSQHWDPAGYGVVCFLAGFSEPFFIGVLDTVTG